jgi:hypothetical protein
MNYEANTIQWRKGSVVIHDADAKEPKMLMLVIGFTRDGWAKTQYCDRRKKRTVYTNQMFALHDPQRFGIDPKWGDYRQDLLEKVQAAWVRRRRWNLHHKIGELVLTTSADGGFRANTVSEAYMSPSGDARVKLSGYGEWSLEFVKAMS